jgi:CBS domain-containing protein
MNVERVMNWSVKSCHPGDSLNEAARLMWENRFGAVPVVDGELKPVGFLTDRDICMAAYTQGKALAELRAESAMARNVIFCHTDDDLDAVMRLMGEKGLRRLPVVGPDGKLVGILSLDDLACEAGRSLRGGINRELRERVGDVWIAICRGRARARV